MNLLPFLLVVAILKNVRNFASACSLLPGGLSKCFPDAVDYVSVSNSELREIKYRLDKKHIFGYDTNKGHIDVRLGQYWQGKVGKKSDTVSCFALRVGLPQTWPNLIQALEAQYGGQNSCDIITCRMDRKENAYLPEHATQLYSYQRDENRKTVGKIPITDLFIITKKEVWLCAGVTKSVPVSFKRIVTEMVSRKPLGSIFFFDGIEVTTVLYPNSKDEDVLNTSIVREVKYVYPENGDQVLRFDGLLTFENTAFGKDEDSSVFKPVKTGDFYTGDTGEFHRDVAYKRKMQKKNFADLYNRQGLLLEDVHRPYGQIGWESSGAICKLQEHDDARRLYSIEYLPRWAQRKLMDQVGLHGYRQTKMEINDFLKNFVVTLHESWTCTILQGGLKFERRVIEYIGKESVSTIDYFNGNKVWKYDLDKTHKSVAIRAVFYFDDRYFFQPINYEGQLKLEKKVEEPVVKEKKSFWQRLISNLFSKKEDMPDDQYKLSFDENNDLSIYNRVRN